MMRFFVVFMALISSIILVSIWYEHNRNEQRLVSNGNEENRKEQRLSSQNEESQNEQLFKSSRHEKSEVEERPISNWNKGNHSEERFVSFAIFHPRLGNQMIRFASGYGVARRLNRTLYVPVRNDLKSKIVQQFWLRIANAFPKTAQNFRFIPGSINATVVPFAVFNGKQMEFTYEDPIRYANHPSKYLVLSISFGRNALYIKDYIAELREMLSLSNEIVSRSKQLMNDLELNNVSAMCVHTRRTDFEYFNVTTDYVETVEAARILARRSNLEQFFIFGEDLAFMRKMARQFQERDNHETRVSTFGEFEDFYLSSQICASFLISAATSTFGWWLAFFSRNQSSVYYIGKQFTKGENVPEAQLFL